MKLESLGTNVIFEGRCFFLSQTIHSCCQYNPLSHCFGHISPDLQDLDQLLLFYSFRKGQFTWAFTLVCIYVLSSCSLCLCFAFLIFPSWRWQHKRLTRYRFDVRTSWWFLWLAYGCPRCCTECIRNLLEWNNSLWGKPQLSCCVCPSVSLRGMQGPEICQLAT